MKGSKKFIDASDKFLEEISALIKTNTVLVKFDNEGTQLKVQAIDVNGAVAMLELIYKGMQSIKLMREDGKKKGGSEEVEKDADDLASRMSGK